MNERESCIRAEIARLKSATETFWYGAVSESTIAQLERLLGVTLPPSFREYLLESGGGGVDGVWLTGIADGDPANGEAGTIWGATKRCREKFGLPHQFVVVQFDDDELCWCLDTSQRDQDGDNPVVSYDVFHRDVDGKVAPSFRQFLRQYVDDHIDS